MQNIAKELAALNKEQLLDDLAMVQQPDNLDVSNVRVSHKTIKMRSTMQILEVSFKGVLTSLLLDVVNGKRRHPIGRPDIAFTESQGCVERAHAGYSFMCYPPAILLSPVQLPPLPLSDCQSAFLLEISE